MAKRPRYSRWRRLPEVFRTGEHKGPDPGQEPRRLTLYLPDALLAMAEVQAARAGAETVQQYCADLLHRALDAERVREQVADIEARRGPLEGLHAISDDPEYLAEWSAQAGARDRSPGIVPVPEPLPTPEPERAAEARPERACECESEAEPVSETLATPVSVPEADREPVTRIEPPVVEPSALVRADEAPGRLSPSAEVILRHAGQGEDDPRAFLPSLRRGDAVALDEVAELAQALNALEQEYRDATVLDRRVVFALHRLAYEAQVLHTDAWPGVFDGWTVDTLRAVQEAVERVLSGLDIRYYPTESRAEDLL